MSLEIKVLIKDDQGKSLLIRRDPEKPYINFDILGHNDQQMSIGLDPVVLLQGIKSAYPELLIQLPAQNNAT